MNKKNINKEQFSLEDILMVYDYCEILKHLIEFEEYYNSLSEDKQLLEFYYDDDDIEVIQMIDFIILQQFYVGANIKTLKSALSIKARELFIDLTFGVEDVLICKN